MAKQKQVLHFTWPKPWILVAIIKTVERQFVTDLQLPIVMPRCVLIPTRLKRHKISQRTEPSTSYSVCGLVGTCGPVVPLPLLPPDICLPLHLSLVSPLDAKTNQHFMWPGAVKPPPWGNLTRHELSRPTSCLLQPPDTYLLCRGASGRVICPNPVSHFTCLFSTPPSCSDSKVWGTEKHVCHSGFENWTPFWTTFEMVGWGSGTGQGGRGCPHS